MSSIDRYRSCTIHCRSEEIIHRSVHRSNDQPLLPVKRSFIIFSLIALSIHQQWDGFIAFRIGTLAHVILPIGLYDCTFQKKVIHVFFNNIISPCPKMLVFVFWTFVYLFRRDSQSNCIWFSPCGNCGGEGDMSLSTRLMGNKGLHSQSGQKGFT